MEVSDSYSRANSQQIGPPLIGYSERGSGSNENAPKISVKVVSMILLNDMTTAKRRPSASLKEVGTCHATVISSIQNIYRIGLPTI